jgi:aminoglycoside phosphotransferase (APT) family kinase protein
MTTEPAVPADLPAVALGEAVSAVKGAVVEPVPAAPSSIRAVGATEGVRPKTSSRDPKKLHADLTAWLTRVLPEGAEPTLGELGIPSGSGMSSETLLFDASWTEGGSRVTTSLVARVAPDPAAAPVFEHYYLDRQYRVMQEVAALTDVPVPNLRWLETDPSALGEAFFVMDRIEGVVPTDLPPYAISGWVAEASPADRQKLQDASVEVLAKLHAIPDAAKRFAFLVPHRTEDSSLRQHVRDTRAYYDWIAADGMASPLIERAFGWLEQNWPTSEGPAVLSWGDSRIGNMMYRDFEPVAVLDWEMAAVAPPELDLAWMSFMHYFFDSMLSAHGLTGLPDMMRPADLAATYAKLSGYEPRDLRFYLTYSCLRYAVIAFRISRRMLLFGEMEMPADVDDLVGVRADLEAMLDGRSALTDPF